MDLDTLQAGVRAGRHRSGDTPDFITRMHYLRPTCSPASPPIGSPPTLSELTNLMKKGSTATSLDELPRSVLQHLPGHGLLAAQRLLSSVSQGAPSALLNAVLHLPLRKKEPAWLLRNSRPVLLEPFLRRCEATSVPRAPVA